MLGGSGEVNGAAGGEVSAEARPKGYVSEAADGIVGESDTGKSSEAPSFRECEGGAGDRNRRGNIGGVSRWWRQPGEKSGIVEVEVGLRGEMNQRGRSGG